MWLCAFVINILCVKIYSLSQSTSIGWYYLYLLFLWRIYGNTLLEHHGESIYQNLPRLHPVMKSDPQWLLPFLWIALQFLIGTLIARDVFVRILLIAEQLFCRTPVSDNCNLIMCCVEPKGLSPTFLRFQGEWKKIRSLKFA